TRSYGDWSSDVCSSDLMNILAAGLLLAALAQTPEKAPAAPPTGEQQTGPSQKPQTPRDRALAQAADQAKKDVDFAAIHLQAAKRSEERRVGIVVRYYR